MNTARILKRAATVGLLFATIGLGSAILQPATTATAAAFPSGRAGAADVGYPNCSGCRVQFTPAAASDLGDHGYPNCGSCRIQVDPDIPREDDVLVGGGERRTDPV